MKYTLLFSALFCIQLIYAQFGPSNGLKTSEAKDIILNGVTVYVNPTTKLEKASIWIENGKIREISIKKLEVKGALNLDYSGKVIVPGFVELYSNIGLPKPNEKSWSYRPQLESNKKGAYYWNESIHPELEAALIYQPDEKANENLRKMGFTYALSHQQDGIVRGTGILTALGKDNVNQQLISSSAAQFYSMSKGSSQQTYPSSQMGVIALLRQALYDRKYYEEAKPAEQSISMEKWIANKNLPTFFKTEDKWEIARAHKIAKEFNTQFVYVGSGNEYEGLRLFKNQNFSMVIPLNFPAAYNVKDPYLARQIPLSDLKHWELAPSNPKLLCENGVKVAFTTNGLSGNEDFWKNIHKALERGLSKTDALAALTKIPAEILGVQNEIGSLENGRWASFSIYENDPFETENQCFETWVQGKIVHQTPSTNKLVQGKYTLSIEEKRYPIEITGTGNKPQGKVTTVKTTTEGSVTKKDTVFQKASIEISNNDIAIQFNCNDDSHNGSISLHAKISSNGGILEGDALLPNGKWVQWSGIRIEKKEENSKPTTIQVDTNFLATNWFPNMAYGFDSVPNPENIVFNNATVWTNEKEGILQNATVIIENGKITYVGAATKKYPGKATVIDLKGKHLTSGIIDEHSHIAISRGVNEAGQSITAEVSIADVVNPDDINIYRQLAGGVTSAQLLHGSANAIGGQSALIKLKWGYTPEEMLIPNAKGFIKCALGENVKQANWGDFNTVRFPQSRMGVEQVFMDGFTRAKLYRQEWKNYQTSNKKNTPSPRYDLELEVLADIIESKRFITCHSYVQSEINMLMHVADTFGFRVNTFTHILEGYKVADKMKEHGAAGSTFADWWAYKFEVNDAIPYNAKLMADQGVLVGINSDDAEMGRRLNQEAAKCVKYGGMSEEDAWKLVTLNPAKMLKIDDKIGSIKVGKDADLVVWSSNPLSITAIAEMTIVDGVTLYDRSKEEQKQTRNASEKARIINKMMASNDKGEPAKPFIKKGKKHFHCNTLGEEGTEEENTH